MPREIFEPLRLACESRNEKLMIASLDCIAKLIAYSFFVEDDEGVAPQHASLSSPPPSPSASHKDKDKDGEEGGGGSARPDGLVDLVVHTVTACHTESTPDAVSLQVVKALLALVLSPTTLVHQSALLRAVRTVYNVFLTSSDQGIQTVAQGGLSQMVGHVFARCKAGRDDGGSGSPKEARADVEEEDKPNGHRTRHAPALTTDDLFVKDAYLVCRAMCKLTMKPLTTESERDLRSDAMRTKLLSLHMVLAILRGHMRVLASPRALVHSGSGSGHGPQTFIDATSQYLCLALSRNLVSPVPQVFELSVEIFWKMVEGLRTKLKQELGVLFHEIFIPVLELKTATTRQKAVMLAMLGRVCADSQTLVDLYLNYDCDEGAVDNIYEHLMNIITEFSSGGSSGSAQPKPPDHPPPPQTPASPGVRQSKDSLPPSLTTAALGLPRLPDSLGASDASLRRQALETLVGVLRSLVAWGIKNAAPESSSSAQGGGTDASASASSDGLVSVDGSTRVGTPDITTDDDPGRFESMKQKKSTLAEGVRRFNAKPKKGVAFLVENGFIASRAPEDVAAFLLSADGLSKVMVGEYLGEADADNIATMHAFVDLIDLRDTPFVEAMRSANLSIKRSIFCASPGRRKDWRKRRYIEGNAHTPFAIADSAYVFSYSVILLNTDAHSKQIKRQTTKDEFVRNNRGINDGTDLPRDFLSDIYDDIANNEIRMRGEVEAHLSKDGAGAAVASAGLASTLASVGRDIQREAYMLQSSSIANKTEALFKTMVRAQRKGTVTGSAPPRAEDQFYSASHFVHVRPMFEVAWLPFLAALSGPLHETDELEVVELYLDGFKHAIRIVCFFEMELERNAFVTTLGKFTFLNNLGEMKSKNMEAIKALLDVAVNEGNHLKGSWREVLSCVSQLEHMQLITSGVDVPDHRKGKLRQMPKEELANESRSTSALFLEIPPGHLSRRG